MTFEGMSRVNPCHSNLLFFSIVSIKVLSIFSNQTKYFHLKFFGSMSVIYSVRNSSNRSIFSKTFWQLCQPDENYSSNNVWTTKRQKFVSILGNRAGANILIIQSLSIKAETKQV